MTPLEQAIIVAGQVTARVPRHAVYHDDMVSDAMFGAYLAASKWEGHDDAYRADRKFSAYAYVAIRRHIQAGVRQRLGANDEKLTSTIETLVEWDLLTEQVEETRYEDHHPSESRDPHELLAGARLTKLELHVVTRFYIDGATIKEIAAELHRTTRPVQAARQRGILKLRNVDHVPQECARPLTERERLVIAGYESGLNAFEIAKTLECSASTVGRLRINAEAKLQRKVSRT